jgi:glycosyltransferase involved in cell wall biosynthesis
MATKTPIISTKVGGLKEMLKDGENAIITQAGNPVDLSEKILQCLNDANIRGRMASYAYRLAQDKYDVPIIVKELSRIFEQLRSP